MCSKCKFTGCKKSVKILRFQCQYCNLAFCLKHQVPESHLCNAPVSPLKAGTAVVPSKISFI